LDKCVPGHWLSAIVAKFKSGDKTKWVAVVELPALAGWSVVTAVHWRQPHIVKQYLVPTATETAVPLQVHHVALRSVATWWARAYARKSVVPSAREERNRRRRAVAKAFAAHTAVVAALPKYRTPRPRPQVWTTPTTKTVFVCVFDPGGNRKTKRPQPKLFTLHRAGCDRVDSARSRAAKHGGDSWVVPADTIEEARHKQLQEFNSAHRGYHWQDFGLCECEGAAVLLKGR
jgi:hypothetical protein